MAYAHALVLLAVLSLPNAGQASSREAGTLVHPGRAWSTTHAPGTIDSIRVDLARGEVTVVRRPGAVRIDAWKLAGERRDAAVGIREDRTGNALHLFDAYPSLHGRFEECHPPPGDRGAFWASDSALKVVISAPDEVDVSTFIMAGGHEMNQVHLPRADE